MSTQTMIELFGYLGSFLVLISFLMTSVAKLRIVNTIGSVIFMIYAFIIRSYPAAIMNFFLVLINLYYLWKMSHVDKEYDFIEVKRDDAYLHYTLNRYHEDIQQSFPGISVDPEKVNKAFMIAYKGQPVGIALGQQQNQTMELVLDYSIPEYRDFSIGSFLMKKLKEEKIEKLTYSGPTENHMDYLNNMGFTKVDNHYEKTL